MIDPAKLIQLLKKKEEVHCMSNQVTNCDKIQDTNETDTQRKEMLQLL